MFPCFTSLRLELRTTNMNFDHPPSDPIQACKNWLLDAENYGLATPNAMTLATVNELGKPCTRIVLLKDFDEQGAVFFTNRLSDKGRELKNHPHASLLFFWDKPHRQIRIDGVVSKTTDEVSAAYFETRNRGSQIGAWASQQSQPIANRQALDDAVDEIEKRYEGTPVPCPPHWGGYRVQIDRIEFWQGLEDRLHDRIVFTADGDGGWGVQRLCP
ncbi:MAG: pyridoxamine 5'-phosphate oxidase [Planctomycetota bacterium]|nr:pyridoxamine 5'-phosphate oxidase [Planctomycetota bacterium]